jgi:hypothetical protein
LSVHDALTYPNTAAKLGIFATAEGRRRAAEAVPGLPAGAPRAPADPS